MNQKILDVLKLVDIDNDEHWTADGAVRVDVVSELAGVDVSRADIASAAPTFTRANTDLTPTTDDFTPEETQELDFTSPWAQSEHVVKRVVEETKNNNEVVLAQLPELQEKREKLEVAVAEAKQALGAVVAQIKELEESLVEPQLTLKQQLDLVHKQDAREQEERLEKMKMVEAIVADDKSIISAIKVE